MNKSKQGGFSFVELAMVMAVMGLLAASVIGVRELVEQARIRGIIKEFLNFNTAIKSFELKYHALPGDMVDAKSYWPDDSQFEDFVTANGDGDGQVEFGSLREDLGVWQHLALAHIISGEYTGQLSDGVLVAGVNIPRARVEGGGYQLRYLSLYSKRTNYLYLAGDSGNEFFNKALLSPQDAALIDGKMDDGVAGTGFMVATTGTSPLMACIDAGSDYITNGTVAGCELFFEYQ